MAPRGGGGRQAPPSGPESTGLETTAEDPCGRQLVRRGVSLGMCPQDRDRGPRKLGTAGFSQPGFLQVFNY